MKYIIEVVGNAYDETVPKDKIWIKSFDLEAYAGMGSAVFTTDINEAIRFDSHTEAFDFWNQQSITRPLRPDGKPNKPLTSYTVSVRAI